MALKNWIVLSIFTGIFFGLQTVLIKQLSRTFHHFQILFLLFILATLFLMPTLFFTEYQIELFPFISTLFLSLIINIISFTLLARAIKSYPISVVMPYVGFTPLFLTLSGFLILGEQLTLLKFFGIFLIVIGGFIVQIPTDWNKREIPFIQRLINTKEKGIGLVIIVAALWSITASVEKITVLASSPEIYAISIHLLLGISFFIITIQKEGLNFHFKLKPNSVILVVIVLGLVSALLAISQLSAIKSTYVAYVIAFKRAGVIVSSLVGFAFFKEKIYGKTIFGTFLILSGAFIISTL